VLAEEHVPGSTGTLGHGDSGDLLGLDRLGSLCGLGFLGHSVRGVCERGVREEREGKNHISYMEQEDIKT